MDWIAIDQRRFVYICLFLLTVSLWISKGYHSLCLFLLFPFVLLHLFYGQRLVLWLLYIALIVLSLLAACLTFSFVPYLKLTI